MKRIRITLEKDRRRPGTLWLIEDHVVGPLFVAPCLGKAHHGGATKKGNPTCNPLKPWGDAPTGLYEAASVMWLERRSPMGEAAIPLYPKFGDAVTAKNNGRWGLYIHAGRGNTHLKETYGCIHMLSRDFYEMVTLIGDSLVSIEITEKGQNSDEPSKHVS